MQSNYKRNVNCKYFSANGICPYGNRCWFLHTPIEIETTTPVSSEVNTIIAESKVSARSSELIDPDVAELCCCICLENVSSTNGLFGLVSGCDHCFCLSCLREWRYAKTNPSDATRQCPVCRVPISYVVPSMQFLTGEEKQDMIKNYFEAMSKKPCKHFKGKPGTCQFGPECFYAHLDRNGEDMKPIDFKKKLRRPRSNIASIEHDLLLLTRLLHHRMNFPFAMFHEDEDEDDENDEFEFERHDDFYEDGSYYDLSGYDDYEEDDDFDEDLLPPLIG